ncbi:ankyrin repeat domain-containing protein [Candidatus Babeliales bacterium]|nr:ankyrin repeat domain-containing protein [Candidatus Babeliales bacterium]
MNFKKTYLSFLLISGLVPTIQADIVQSITNNDIKGMKHDYNNNNNSFVEPFMDTDLLEIISPIHKAAMTTNDPKVLELLFSKGAHINKKSELGKTPLYYALTYNPNTDIALYLIDKGANVNAHDNFGKHVFFSINQPKIFRSDIDRAKILTKMTHRGLNLSNLFNTFTMNTPAMDQNNTENLKSIDNPYVTEEQLQREMIQKYEENSFENLMNLFENEKRNIYTNEQTQVLTDEDVCGVCLGEVTALAKDNIKNYKTDCCNQFLCTNCIQKMNNANKTTECPYCRENPLIVSPVSINIENVPAIATTLSESTLASNVQ